MNLVEIALKRKFYIKDKLVYIETEQEKTNVLENIKSQIIAAKLRDDEYNLHYYSKLLIKLKDIIS